MCNHSNELASICEIFSLDRDAVESLMVIRHNDVLFLDLKLKDKRPPCPDCANTKVKIKQYVPKKINNSILSNRSCTLVYHARRYVCPVCHKTYAEYNPFVVKKMKIAIDVVLSILNDLTEASETFSSVATRYHVSSTTAANLFDEYVTIERRKFPEVLSVDENYAFHSREQNSKYICVLIDPVNGYPIDILESRRFDYLKKYFSAIPKEERDAVRYICTDMYEVYRRVFKIVFPSACLCVDKLCKALHNRSYVK